MDDTNNATDINVDDSILLSIKKMLGMEPEFTQFDPDIILHINTIIQVLYQIGLDIPEGFVVVDQNNLWTDYIQNPRYVKITSLIKQYIFMRVRMIFDPPSSQTLSTAIQESINEMQWRISQWIDYYEQNEPDETNKEEVNDNV